MHIFIAILFPRGLLPRKILWRAKFRWLGYTSWMRLYN